MTLPYDISRCSGTDNDLCKSCRRTEPGCEYRQSFFRVPPIDENSGECAMLIENQGIRFTLAP
jgi:hypothetical protein